MTMPVEKPKNFRGSLRRLVGELRPEALMVGVVMVARGHQRHLSASSAPKILGNATNSLFTGVIGKQLRQPGGHPSSRPIGGPAGRGPGPAGRHAVGHDTSPRASAWTSGRSAGSCSCSPSSTC